MIDLNVDFFQITDNFSKTSSIPSIPIFEAKHNSVPKITIAIPTYKRPTLLKEALDSAINQIGFNEYEIIVVDNNPERGCETEQLMKSHNNSRISYYKNSENIGMFGNWNRCIELAKGEFLTILNDDDILIFNYLNKVSSFVNSNKNVDVLLVGIESFTSSSEISKKKKTTTNYVYQANRINLLFGNINPGSLGAYFRKEILVRVGGFNELFYPISDYVLWLNILKNKNNVLILSEKLAYYRILVNESLKIEIQELNILYENLLRRQLSSKILNLEFIIKIALPAFSYFHHKRVAEYSNEYKIKNIKPIIKSKRELNILNIIAYYILVIIKKATNIYYRIFYFGVMRKFRS